MGPVAGAAKQGRPDRKIQKRFDRRTNDFAIMKGKKSGNCGVNPEGYHRPGSMQKARCR